MTSVIDITAKNCQVYLEGILEIKHLTFPSLWSLWAFKAEIKNPISHLWALTVDDVLAGYICFWMFDREIQLVNIAVHPHKRGKGFGRYLFTRMIEAGISEGKQHIWLEVRPSNAAAQRLYHGLGFETMDCRPCYYLDNNEDAIVMGLTLPKKEIAV